jgi:hypothetical protein
MTFSESKGSLDSPAAYDFGVGIHCQDYNQGTAVMEIAAHRAGGILLDSSVTKESNSHLLTGYTTY